MPAPARRVVPDLGDFVIPRTRTVPAAGHYTTQSAVGIEEVVSRDWQSDSYPAGKRRRLRSQCVSAQPS